MVEGTPSTHQQAARFRDLKCATARAKKKKKLPPLPTQTHTRAKQNGHGGCLARRRARGNLCDSVNRTTLRHELSCAVTMGTINHAATKHASAAIQKTSVMKAPTKKLSRSKKKKKNNNNETAGSFLRVPRTSRRWKGMDGNESRKSVTTTPHHISHSTRLPAGRKKS